MSKFKKGDRVVLTGRDYPITKVGWTGQIVRISKNTADVKWDECENVYTSLCVDSIDVEIDLTYDSPLRIALR